MKMGKLIIGVVAVVAVAAAVFHHYREPIADRLYAKQVKERMGRDHLAGLKDGLHAAFCGTGSPLPDPTRAPACTLVIAGTHLFVVDSGAGSTANILMMGLSAGRIEAAFLTHYHSDHIGGLGDLAMQRWVGTGNTAPLPVYGPDGVEGVVEGFNKAYALDDIYRPAHHGEDIVPPSGAGMVARSFSLQGMAPAIVYDAGDLTVRAVLVDHDPVKPAVAYRFDYGGRSLVVSGDLDAKASAGFKALAAGADLLIVEALQPKLVARITEGAEATGNTRLAKITRDILDYHTTPEEAADAATAAGAKALVLTHVVPALPSKILYPAFVGEAGARFDGPIRVAEDGMAVSLPAGRTDVTFTDWF
ncbi:MBL fold metallo-hydrolase [Gimibacter soli]|uniref:MBL fold metallo-hydrolase n=1 Tax=Gimibacter soli TaxID=3024400 RepID=A0AAE9XMS1_9PROT|nr:MBL fold metallo-hydrolase [Gimibacter soli]WCL53847.1 MBL fold metallo-hydrolase [Gimibacter soli]